MAGLALGCALGIVGNVTGWGPIIGLSALLDPVASVWMGALQVAVVPLVVVQMMAAVLSAPAGGAMGRLAARTVVLFVLLLVGAALATVAITPGLLALYDPSPETAVAIRANVEAAPPGVGHPGAGEASSPSPALAFLLDLVTGRHILPLLVLALVAALALLRLPRDLLARVRDRIDATSVLLLRGVRWILLATPLAVFAILLGMALEAGLGVAGVVVVFIVMMSALLLLATAALYPLTFVLSGLPVADFARAVRPAQLVALGTRSSIASLPALLQEAENELRLPPPVTGMVIPLSVAVFKMNRTVSATFQLLFLAYVFGVPLSVGDVATFVGTVLLLSFGSLGVPGGGGGMRSLPAYLAAGIPMQGYLLANASETIPDIFKTILNVTADMAVAVIVAGRDAVGATSDRRSPRVLPETGVRT